MDRGTQSTLCLAGDKMKKIIYSVEEVEGQDGGFSTEFETLEEAKKYYKKLFRKPTNFTTDLRLWICVVIEEVQL